MTIIVSEGVSPPIHTVSSFGLNSPLHFGHLIINGILHIVSLLHTTTQVVDLSPIVV